MVINEESPKGPLGPLEVEVVSPQDREDEADMLEVLRP
jgi:hypothetical protein